MTPRRIISRRDLLQGKLWKLLAPAKHKPLVMRYPRPGDLSQLNCLSSPKESDNNRQIEEAPKPPPRTIGGIAIELVAPTNLSMRAIPQTIPVFRPPGAIEEQQFLAGCTRCGDCITACPHHALRQAPMRLGAVAGTPIIEADLAACLMCSDFPCIAACEPGVLSHSIPIVMGTAQITAHLCLAHHNTTCTVCSERCPVEGAIEVSHGKPTIREEVCTGCGVCRYVCPAPERAILLMPTFSRPALPAS
ncbi:MAG: 4Fe-4S dicluster domain-containing protein [Aureliella sp.]